MTLQPKSTKEFRLRPTLIVGLGGTGHRIAVRLKSLVWRSLPAEQVEQWVKFLVFDTAQEDLVVSQHGRTIRLEPGSEFHDIGQTPVANIKRNLARQSAIEERLGGVMASLPPTVLRNGAKQLRPLGLLALLWRYTDVETHLREAIWALAGRQHTEEREGINVFIINSLVGGTGSSAFLDVAYVIRDLFDELGTLADFCYITGVGVLPGAFHGINGPNLAPNAVASLKELNHCMLHGGFTARYPNGRMITTVQPPFNIYYLVDGIDERGHTWGGLSEVCRLAAEAIFLQMGSQVGQKHENDFDNLDEVLVGQTEEGDGTFYGSFGLASLVFPRAAVAHACAARQTIRVIEHGLLAPLPTTMPDTDPSIARQVSDFIEAAELDPDRLMERLASDDEGLPLVIDLTVPGWVNRLSPSARPSELVRYVRDYEQARLNTDFKRWLTQNETRLASRASNLFSAQLARLARQAGLAATEQFLGYLLESLNAAMVRLNVAQIERESQQVALNQELGHLETAFLQAGESNFLWRSQRVARTQHAYFTVAQNLFTLRWQSQITAGMMTALNQVSRVAQEGLAACQATSSRLKTVQRTLQVAETAYNYDLDMAGVTTQSLASPPLVAMLFEQHAPPVTDTLATLFSDAASPLDWRDTAPVELEKILLTACQPAFIGIAKMTIEQVIALPAAETPPESYYVWLTGQATPSWNLDRARLPEGGAGLHRLQVIGVPDETNSLYRRHANSLVSTGEPTRITAFVAHVGAAHTAIQQWDSYQATYKQARGRMPLHILPHFQADNERARQTFALASLFGFVTNQGAYFYYIPADPLARPVKLAQGLANSLNVFTAKDGLVQEVRERVEQVVAQRGVEATLRTLSQHYETAAPNNGRFQADDLVLELKRLVRAYADELRQIHQFAALNWTTSDSDSTRTELTH